MLMSPEKYRYLGVSGCFEADGVDDAKEFEDTQKSMKLLGFTPKQQSWVFKTVAAILHLGSIRFKSSRKGNADGCEVKSGKRLKRAADLLGVPVESLEKAVTYRSITIGRKKNDDSVESHPSSGCLRRTVQEYLRSYVSCGL